MEPPQPAYDTVKIESFELLGTDIKHFDAKIFFKVNQCRAKETSDRFSQFKIKQSSESRFFSSFEVRIRRKDSQGFDGYLFRNALVKPLVLEQNHIMFEARGSVSTTTIGKSNGGNKWVEVPYQEFYYPIANPDLLSTKQWLFDAKLQDDQFYKFFDAGSLGNLDSSKIQSHLDTASATGGNHWLPDPQAISTVQKAMDNPKSVESVSTSERQSHHDTTLSHPQSTPGTSLSDPSIQTPAPRSYFIDPPFLVPGLSCRANSDSLDHMTQIFVLKRNRDQSIVLDITSYLCNKPRVEILWINLTPIDKVVWPTDVELPFTDLQVRNCKQEGLDVALGNMPKLQKLRFHNCPGFSRADLDRNLGKLDQLALIEYN